MLMRMVTSFASSLSRRSNVLAAPSICLCRMQPAPCIRYEPDHLSQVPPQQLVNEFCVDSHSGTDESILAGLTECVPGPPWP